MSKAQDHRKRTLEWIILEILADEPKGCFPADIHRIIEERTTITLDMHRLLDALRRLCGKHTLDAHWEGQRQRFCLPSRNYP